MGRHSRPDEIPGVVDRPRIVMGLTAARPADAVNPVPPLAPATTVVITTPAEPRPAPTVPPPAPHVAGPTPGVPPSPVIEAAGPPDRVGRRARRADRKARAEAVALSARIARAQRRTRQVSAAVGANAVRAHGAGAHPGLASSAPVIPAQRTAPPVAAGVPGPSSLADARPPMRSPLPAPPRG